MSCFRCISGKACFLISLSSTITNLDPCRRSTTFRTEEIDQPPPQISQELDFDVPLCKLLHPSPRHRIYTSGSPDRSSTFHYSSTLMLLASDVMSKIYTHQPGVTYEARKSQMSGLHLLLENWRVVSTDFIRSGLIPSPWVQVPRAPSPRSRLNDQLLESSSPPCDPAQLDVF